MAPVGSSTVMTRPGVWDPCWVFRLLLVAVTVGPYIVAAQGPPNPLCPNQEGRLCCRFPMFSPEFFDCCNVVGCCPVECMEMPTSTTTTTYTTTTTTIDEPSPACERGRLCCRFPPESIQFARCLERHRCRPECHQVSRGCCYNGSVWAWGSVVEEFEEVCLNLVCAAQERDEPPFLDARLVLVERLGEECDDRLCESCRGAVCVDETGAVRQEGEEFLLDECSLCTCLAGGRVECRRQDVKCPPLPTNTPPRCQVVEGPCCPMLNCSVDRTCLDTNNQVHALYATWKSDPCTSHQCTLAGITTTRQECPEKPYPNCVPADELEEEEEEEETEEDDTYSEENEEDEEEDECCPKWKCGPDCRLVRCSNVPPGPDCTEVFEPLACCPSWNCSGCVDDGGQYHEMGSSWHPTPCTTLTCTPLGVINTTAPCKPKPHEVCSEDTTKKGCCPVYDCGMCTDKDYKLWPMFSKWEVGHCVFRKCTPWGIVTVEPECPRRPHRNCFEGPLDKECCPQWECGPDCTHVECEDAPQRGCIPHVLPLACCPQWNCSVCVDEFGRRREAGSSWRTDDPCINKTCTETGEVVSVAIACALSERPREGCFPYTPVGECCSRWNCSGCLDDNGTFHKLFQAWNTDPCTSHFCNPSGIYTQVVRCPTLGPMPHPNCVVQVPTGQCCAEWVCGDDCRLIFCGTPPHGDCTSHRPPLACCDEWTCDGCTDDAGKRRKTGEVWLENNCLFKRCTKQGITTTNFCDRYYAYQRRKRDHELANGEASASGVMVDTSAEPSSPSVAA